VKHFFLKILLLVIGFAYTSSVLELDAKECKENYQKENHSCIHQDNENNTHCVIKITDSDYWFIAPTVVGNYLFIEIEPASEPIIYQVYSPPKLFILHSVFII